MASSEFEVVVVGGGAAGIAAAARLIAANIDTLVVEARGRLGGRSWTAIVGDAFAVDVGCGWLHSADRNPWREIAELQGQTIDSTLPSWTAPSAPISFPPFDEAAFMSVLRSFRARLKATDEKPDRAAADLLEPNGRWNRLLDAVSTFYSGAELDRLSAHDFARYDDTDINWRVLEGFGTVIAAYGADLPVKLACLVGRIDRRGRRLKVETTDGVITADAAIITLPSNLLAEAPSFFSPALPEKAEAAAGLPLGLADKLFLSLSDPEEFERDTRLFGRTDRTGTGRYHFRPFGRPMIEAYFGGELAADLEAGDDSAFLDFAISELVGIFGSAFARRLKVLQIHRWGTDPYSRGSYSYALPGKAECRTTLADPVDERLFFAGEACSRSHFSTAHGAYLTGITAADQAITALRRRRS